MDSEEARQRREAAQVIATARRRGSAERRADDARLGGRIREAFARQRAGELGEDGQVGMEPDPVESPPAERGAS